MALYQLFGPYAPVSAGVILLLILIEAFWKIRTNRNSYNLKEIATNTFILAGYVISKVLTVSYNLAVLSFFGQFAFYHFEQSWWVLMLSILGADFIFYWFHRISHTVKIFWAFHLVHHSSPWMNLTTAYRLNWLSPLIIPWFFIPLALLGFPPVYVTIGYTLNLFYQFFMHTESVGKIPLVEGVLNTPSAHRVHHGSNPIYIDKNYGGILMIWDRIFDTYQPETEEVKYGITTGFVSHNPFKLIFHGFIDLFKNKMDYKG